LIFALYVRENLAADVRFVWNYRSAGQF